MSPLPPTRRLLRAAAWLVPLGVLANVGLALLTTDAHMLREVGRVTAGVVALAAGFALIPWVTQSLRIGLWTRFVGHPISFLGGLRIAAGGVLGSAVTPTAIGGGTIRWALATRQGLPAGQAASLLAVEAVEDLVFFAVAVPLAVTLSAASEARAVEQLPAAPTWGMGLPVLAAAGAVALVVLVTALAWRVAARGRLGPGPRRQALRLAARVRQPGRRAWADVRRVTAMVATRGKLRFAASLALTAVQWIARYSIATVVVVALGGPFKPFLFWVLGWLTVAASSAVPTPGAVGAAEATFYLVHAPFVAAETLVVVTAAWRLLIFYVPALAAVVVFPGLGAWQRRRDGAHRESGLEPERRRADEPRAENAPPGPGPEALPVPSGTSDFTLPDG